MNIIEVPVDKLIPYENNPRIISEEAVDVVAASIEAFDFQQPIVIDKNYVVIAGHTRLKAAKQLGLETVPCKIADELNDAEAAAYRLADNKTGEFSKWDFEKLPFETQKLETFKMEQFGFETESLNAMSDTEIVEDDYEAEIPEEPKSKLGDIYQLGRHRLMCGDSTDPAVIDKLMDGVKADMVFTDPPYNIASDSKNFAADVSKAMKDLSESEWDKDFDIREVLDNILVSIAENATVYVCTSHFLASNIWAWMKEWADHYSYCVWSKPNPMPSLSKRHWTWNTELICYATRGKHTFNFPKEGHALSTWTINKRNGDTGHPTEKPVEVPAMFHIQAKKRMLC